jgi:hypothetical protein
MKSFSRKSIELLIITIIGVVIIAHICGCLLVSEGYTAQREGYTRLVKTSEGYTAQREGYTRLVKTSEGYTGWQGAIPRPPPPVITEKDIAPLRRRLEELFHTLGEQLCPSFNMVKEEMMKAIEEGTKEEKGRKAIAKMETEAGGPLFDCRSYPDHLQVPANIGAIILSTATYLDKKLARLLGRVEAALSCKPVPVEESFTTSKTPLENHYTNVVEYYADVPTQPICTPTQLAIREADAATAAARSCADPKAIPYSAQKQLLEMRIQSLERIYNDRAWAGRIARIKIALNRFQEIKAKIDAGTLVPNCGPGF